MTDLFIEGALWILIVLGACAWIWLFGEGVERFCDAWDDWQKATFKNYADDDDFVAR